METTWRITLLVGAVLVFFVIMACYMIRESKVIQKRFLAVILERAGNLAKNDMEDARSFIKKHLPTLLSLNVNIIPKEFNILRCYAVYYKKYNDLISEMCDEKKNLLSQEILKRITDHPFD